MKIDGKQIAEELLQNLQKKIIQLKLQGVKPTLAVIFVGDNPESLSYIKQKQNVSDAIGAEIKMFQFPSTIDQSIINETIQQCNNDPFIHGIILQLPLPSHFDVSINESVDPKKDVDGFVSHSKFKVPVAMAVEKILQQIYKFQMFRRRKSFGGQANDKSVQQLNNLPAGKAGVTMKQCILWLKKQRIVVIGRGETGGRPIFDYLVKQGCSVSVVHSQTPEKEKLNRLTEANIIISCVGKKGIVQSSDIKKGVILLSVGIFRDSQGKPHGDYEEDEIKNIASFYTPTPGGVGPINVACLMENLVFSASKCIKHL